MTSSHRQDVDALIRQAFEAEGMASPESLAEPGLLDGTMAVLKSRLGAVGALFLFMVLLFFLAAVVCAVQLLAAEEVPEMLRWCTGFLLSVMAVLGGKIWFWMELQRVAVTREVRRAELLVALLARRLHGSGTRA